MSVPFIDLQRFEVDFLERWAERCQEVTCATRFVGGKDVARLESRLARDAGVAEVVGCANGTDALQLALRAVGVGPGDAVIVPDATFWATFESVVNVGARPVTVDIEPSDLQMDFDQFVAAVERFTPRAAVLVHLYGWGSSRIDEYRAYCRARELPLVEDGAQSFGCTWQDVPLQRDALLATMSFYPAKVLGSCGDAGAVYCSTTELAERVRQLGNHGRTSHYEHGLVGWNSRMGGLDAAYLDLSLDYVAERVASRRRAAERYRSELGAAGVYVAGPPDGYEENAYLNVTLIDPDVRPAIESALRANSIGFGTVYPGAMSKQPGAIGHLAASVGGEEADRLCRSVINLPLFAHITPSELDEVIEVVAAAHAATQD